MATKQSDAQIEDDATIKNENKSGPAENQELEQMKKMFQDGANGPVTAKVTMDLNGGILENPSGLTVKSVEYPAGANGGGTRGGKKRRKKRRSTKKKRKQKQKKRAK